MEKVNNGFASEEQYKKTLEMILNVQENVDEGDRDFLVVTYDNFNNVIKFQVDFYLIRIWHNYSVDIDLIHPDLDVVDGGIVAICAKLLEMAENCEFDFVFGCGILNTMNLKNW